jgi:glycosyltransferase involved in cell wall biosynthesis
LNRLSVVVITLDEARDLPRCLESVAWADEIVVVDSGSTDGTLELCRDWPKVRLVEQPFLGFGPQKRFAVAQASHDWVLSLDADEVVTAELAAALREFLAGDPAGLAGATLTRRMVFLGRVFRHGRDSRQRLLRLFDRRRGNFTGAPVHERVEVDGPTAALAGTLLHYSYRDLSDYFEKFNRYTSLTAMRMHENGRKVGVGGIIVRPPWAFLNYYLVRGNWLNGLPGFVYALLSAFYKTVKYIKLYERQGPAPGP